uniref:RNA-directed DNA polymerase n=1 Tax=Phytophthora ramorum TaxID=164328 RepID=H3H7K4_PHYRM
MDRSEFTHLIDSQFESVRKMAGIFGMDALQSLAAATPAEQLERPPVAERKPVQPKPLRLKVNPYKGKEGENLHFWVREVELAMDAALVSDERLRVAFALSHLSGRAKSSAYTREATTPGCFASWAQLCEQLRAAFLPANYEYRQRSRFLACKQGRRELHEYIQEMRELTASLVGNPLHEYIKVTVFMDGLRVGPARTQLFRVQANTLEEAIQIALQEEYSHRHAHTPATAWLGGSSQGRPQSRGPFNVPVPMDLSLAEQNVEVTKVFMDLSVKFEDFNSTERFLVLDMDKYDLILGMPWLEKHEPWIDWRGNAIGASLPAATDRALVSHVPTSVSNRAYPRSRVGNDSEELVAAGAATGVMTPSTAGNGPPQAMPVDRTSSPARGTAMPTVPTAPDYGTVRPSSLSTPGEVNSPKETSPRETKAVETVARVEVAGSTSSVGNNVPHGVDGTPDSTLESPPAVGNKGPRRGGHRRRHRRRKPSLLGQTGVATSDSERENSPQARPAEECYHFFDGETGCTVKAGSTTLAALPEVSELLNLEEMSIDDFLAQLKAGAIAEMVLLKPEASPEELTSSSVMDKDVLGEIDKKRATRTGSAILENPKDPVYPLVKEFSDVVSKDPPSQLPPDRGVRHEIDLVPGTKHCVTRQCPLPREQCEVIDAFFAAKAKAGMVRESKSPHSTPTFCVRKPNGKWRLVHAYNKLNNATVPAQTPIPRKDVLLNNMAGCELYSALDLVDGYYQILMRERDIPLTAVSTPSGMLWEWLVMPQGLSNAPATFNRLVTQLFRPLRAFTQTYFDDIFVHSRAGEGKTAIEVHLEHLRRVFMVMRANKLYVNIDKCVFAAQETKVLGCFVSSVGVRADPEKVKAIAAWPTPRSQKDLLRKWLGLANYLHKYSAGIKASLQRAPVLALPDETKPFSVVCDASDYAIGCALLQHDADGHERVIAFQSRQLKAAERNYPVHDKELLAMKYALVKFRLHLLGSEPFVIYTDHASLRTATNSPHLSQSMARWLSFFAEYNFRVEYKPGKLNVLADALSRRPDYELAHISRVTTDLYDRIRLAYRDDENLSPIVRFLTAGTEAKPAWLTPRHRARLHCYAWVDGLLHYRVDPADPPRIVVPNDEDLKYDILQEAHDVPSSGHLGREKTFLSVSQVFWWAHMYKWVATYVETCETCQRVKPAGHASAPLRACQSRKTAGSR